MDIAFKKGSKQRLKAAKKTNQSVVTRVLNRIQMAVPHLTFSEWSVIKARPDDVSGTVDTDERRRQLRVMIVADDLYFESHCHREKMSVISADDHRFLNDLATEAGNHIKQSGTTESSLADFGTNSVAEALKRNYQLIKSPLPILQFLRNISQQTYENQRISYGIIIWPTAPTSNSATDFLISAADNKRYKHLSDGYATSMLLDGGGNLIGLEPLKSAANRGKAARRRPIWLANLAENAERKKGLGISLTRQGDILVAQNGKLAYSQRAGVWKRWDHSAIVRTLQTIGKFEGKPHDFASVMTFLYQIALDLSFRRSGGLFVVLRTKKNASKLLSVKEQAGSLAKENIDIAMDRWLQRQKIHRWERQLVTDIASLDGSIVIDRNGNLVSYGQVLKIAGVSAGGAQGARTRAAIAGSKYGLALKVSADGDISFYSGGEKRFEI
jgi:hypothetical protein